MSSLLPPNSTQYERDLEASMSRISDVPVPIGTLWNPQTCPETHLAWLAWALSVEGWHDELTEQEKRDMIAQSADYHRRKGTKGAILEIARWILDIADLDQHRAFEAPPHSFRLRVEGDGRIKSKAHFDRLVRMVNSAKAARSNFFSLQVKKKGEQTPLFGTAIHALTETNVRHEVRAIVDPQQPLFLTAVHCSTSYSIGAMLDG
ncbi:phage tail protein I [Marinomonas ostreistagni]|uniref:Phage tail protein I n=1 Tax=Marinomonas ostreistagni TaxID=359209 RepID=A0ABS0ZAP8_9GAMM|nr:phage tail protein I [Marinomonas ostreistagni]MBJ7550738.1 phage tail protein I [Marinomonas ostreistagni]